MNAYSVMNFGIEEALANLLYYRGVAIVVKCPEDSEELVLHYDVTTNIRFDKAISYYVSYFGCNRASIKYFIEAKGE